MSLQQRGKLSLLGASSVSPPAALQGLSPYSDEDEHSRFINDTRVSPEAFWRNISNELTWITPPSTIRSGGHWFPDGRLNIAAACLAGAAGTTLRWKRSAEAEITTIDGPTFSRMVYGAARRLESFQLPTGAKVGVCFDLDLGLLVSSLACLHLGLVACPVPGRDDPAKVPELLARNGYQALVTSDARLNNAPGKNILLLPDLPDEADAFTAMPVDSRACALSVPGGKNESFSLACAGFLAQAFSAFRHLLADNSMGAPLWVAFDDRPVPFLAACIGALVSGSDLGLLSTAQVSGPDGLAAFLKEATPRRLLADTGFLSRVVGEDQPPRGSFAFSPELLLVEGDSFMPSDWSATLGLFAPGVPHVVQLLARPEAGGFIAGSNPLITPVRVASVGQAAPGTSLVVVDGNGKPCPPGVGGFLALSQPCPGLALELHESSAPFPLDVKARQDRSGHIWTLGEQRAARPSSGGFSLIEIETFIASIPSVEQVAIVRFDDPSGASRTRAFIVPAAEASDDVLTQIGEAVSSRHGGAAVPDSFQFVTELPRSRSGKLLRSVLRRISSGEPMGPEDISIVSPPPGDASDD